MSKSKYVESQGNILSSFGPIEEEYEITGSHNFGYTLGTDPDSEAIEIPLVSADTLAGQGQDSQDIINA